MWRALLLVFLVGCAEPEAQPVRLATTTSTANSGLVDHLLTAFTEETGIRVKPMVVGTGRALAAGQNGDADILLVHARPLEDAFLAEGHASERRDVMYNDFVIAGPPSDPAGIRGFERTLYPLLKIRDTGSLFVSRGDRSGTHHRERALWKDAGIEPEGLEGYTEVGGGMAACLIYADEKKGYVLTDRGTYLAVRKRKPFDLEILVEGHPTLRNPYGLLLVDPERHPGGNAAGARRLMDWLTSERGQALIGAFRVDGETLFHPNARP
ncbi:MAG: substrate-binding domain-containing protein [Planctomycetota bacterium]|nr:substrate-binding domain-containing protein [Planctomycetota bacterium]